MTRAETDRIPAGDDATRPEGTGTQDARGPARIVQKQGEIGGPPGPEPTRYGDWEFKGRCSDF